MTVKRFGTPPPKIDHKLDRDIFKSALSSNCQKRQSADATNVAQSGKLDENTFHNFEELSPLASELLRHDKSLLGGSQVSKLERVSEDNSPRGG